MNNTNTGGPAFPCEWDYIGSNREAANGMTLRDYFAAKAMHGLISSPHCSNAFDALPMAETSYTVADAMLKARAA